MPKCRVTVSRTTGVSQSVQDCWQHIRVAVVLALLAYPYLLVTSLTSPKALDTVDSIHKATGRSSTTIFTETILLPHNCTAVKPAISSYIYHLFNETNSPFHPSHQSSDSCSLVFNVFDIT
ncbi:hypothetical protein J6590_062447 [Homalodisca vitripennis]|nr:hypothetical protein J6590_062447 [Homalodisca vitripennis]